MYVQAIGQQLTRVESALKLSINILNVVVQLETPVIRKKEVKIDYVIIKSPSEIIGFKLHPPTVGKEETIYHWSAKKSKHKYP